VDDAAQRVGPRTVGREFQLQQISESWHRAKAGRGSLMVVAGEAGAGKTHVLEHIAERCEHAGEAAVAWGPCPGPDAPPLWAWHRLAEDLGLASARVAPHGVDGVASSARWADPTADRRRALGELVDELRRAGARPTLLLLDDFHWADLDSIALLRLLVPELPRTKMLCLIAMRPDEPTATSDQLREAIADLGSSCVRVHLGGLDERSVASLTEHWAGESVDPDTIATIMTQTAGNPLFVRELVGLLMSEGGLGRAGSGHLRFDPLVRDVLVRRVDRRGPRTRRLLEFAAVAGREIGITTLVAAADAGRDDVLALLDDAQHDGLIVVTDEVVRFTHDLVREALADSMSDDSRRTTAASIATALREHGGPGSGLAEIAAHLVNAVPLVDPADAAAAALASGRASLAAHAPADAVQQLERGLAILDGRPHPLTADLHLALGEALASIGERDASVAAFDRAAEVSRRLGDADGFAAAVLGRAGMIARPRTDHDLVAALREAIDRYDRVDGTAARLRARLAHALLFTDEHDHRSALASEAVEIARAGDDLDALGQALYVWILVHSTSGVFDDRLAHAEELVGVARRSGDPIIEAYALHLHAHLMAELGDYATFDADVAAYGAIADRIASATWQWTAHVHRAMRSTMTGDLIEGERLGDEAFGLGVRSQHSVAQAVFGSHLMGLRTWQGRLGELLPAVRTAAGLHRELPAMWASIPYIQAEDGMVDEARDELRRLLSDGRFTELPGAQSWPVAVAMLARAAALTESADVGDIVLPMVEALGDRHVVGPFGDVYLGPAAFSRSMCQIAQGRLDLAATSLREAIDAAAAVGARPVVASATAELSMVLRRRGDTAQAVRLRQMATADLRRIGMTRHLERLERSFDGPAPSTPSAPSAPTAAPNRFCLVDRRWTLQFAGTSVDLPASKGLGDLHRLVRSPETEIHVLELVAGSTDLPRSAPDAALDERAKREYRARIIELEAEIDDAEAASDLARAERARAEHDAVLEELYRAVGLGGRDRTIVDEAERARQAVRARVSYALDKIDRAHPMLGRHLRNAVVTGMFCSYRPERPSEWLT
jgi:tetratricopeptide (TPR) repeat protein